MCVFKTYKEYIMGIILYFFHIYSIFALPHPITNTKVSIFHCSNLKSHFRALFCCKYEG